MIYTFDFVVRQYVELFLVVNLQVVMDAFHKQERVSRSEHEAKIKEREDADKRIKEIAEKKKREREEQECKIKEITEDEADKLQKEIEEKRQELKDSIEFLSVRIILYIIKVVFCLRS